jgi:hypothetical protein
MAGELCDGVAMSPLRARYSGEAYSPSFSEHSLRAVISPSVGNAPMRTTLPQLSATASDI